MLDCDVVRNDVKLTTNMQTETARTNRKLENPNESLEKREEYVHMTRDELRGIIEGISDEQLKKILDINSQDIKKAKANVEEIKTNLEEVNLEKVKMAETIEALKEGQREADEIRVKMEELQKNVELRDKKEAEDLLSQELCKRFDEVSKNIVFVNDFTRNGIFEQFKMALSDEENIGRADSEIFGQLTNGLDNLFMPQADAPRAVASARGFGGALSDGEIREIMGI